MSFISILAQANPEPRSAWAPVVLLILIGVGFAVGNLILSIWIGPKRTGPGKELTYESGMVPVGNARQRFNVRFYLVAMVFLVFDVEIVFFYPWAVLFPQLAGSSQPHLRAFAGLALVEMIVFVVILLVAYLYAWGKGVFSWD